MSKVADVVVIGAGVLGCSVAYHLARKGVKVIVLEKANIGSGTSATGVGAVNIQSKGPGFYLEMNLASSAYYPEFAASLDGDIEFVPSGGCHIAETEPEMQKRVAFMEEQKKTPGFKVEYFFGKEVKDIEPAISTHVAGLTYCPQDGMVNPFLLAWVTARTARRLGTVFETETEVVDIQILNKGYKIITAKQGAFEAPIVVNCAGTGAKKIGAMVGADLQIDPMKGQLLVTERLPRLFRHLVSTLGQTASGNILIGATAHFGVDDTKVNYMDIKAMASRAVRLVPTLKNVSLIRCWAGVRPYPADGYPILG
ncbi:MAG: FAD-binding oxidoreductase, partial [Clostridia bacterium]|nr:FAD-binding oxidoreductase [Clostridia bacterium]